MKIYSIGAQEPLAEHLEEIKQSNSPSAWRCFTTKLDKELYNDPYARRIILNFIEENYKDFDVYEFSFYWLKTGHVFLLFQGRMKKAHSTFEKFLVFISENENSAKVMFETYDMGRQSEWVEDTLKDAVAEIQAQKPTVRKKKVKQKPNKKEEEEQKQEEELERIEKLKEERNLRIKPLLLVVEDERMTQAFISALLENYCEVVLVETIAEGRALYRELWPSLVFMDIMLPDGDGQDLTEELIALDMDAYVVMVSGCISDEKIMRCKVVGAKGFVAKPVTQNKERLMQQIFNYNEYKKEQLRKHGGKK